MRPRAYLPILSLVFWGWFALGGVYDDLANSTQELYYRWLPVGMTALSIVLVLLLRFESMKIPVQIAAVSMLLALLPYLFFFTGGM